MDNLIWKSNQRRLEINSNRKNWFSLLHVSQGGDSVNWHCEYGPAVTTNKPFWILNDTAYTFSGWLNLLPFSDQEKTKLVLKLGCLYDLQ